MEYIDHVAARVSLCALSGFSYGTVYASWKGLPLRSTSFKIATSFAMAGTALFGFERIGYAATQYQQQQNTNDNNQHFSLFTSHSFAGITGGAINGYLYRRKPIQGVIVFVPIMLGFALLELTWQKKKLQRIQELLLTEEEEDQEETMTKRGETTNENRWW